MQVQIQTITPDYAAALLANNTANRPLTNVHADRLAAAIRRGEWKLNGDPIRISDDGVLLDGQHRLTAVVRAGIPVQSLVIGGLPKEVFDTIDIGAKRRGTADVMAIRGEKNCNMLAASALLYHQYINFGSPFSRNGGKLPSTQQLIATLDNEPMLRDAASMVASHQWIRKNMTASIGAFCWVAFHKFNAEKAEQFFYLLATGEGLHKGSPVLLLRERLMADASAITSTHREYKTAITFKAFRYFIRGTEMETLRIRTMGPSVEKDLFDLAKKT